MLDYLRIAGPKAQRGHSTRYVFPPIPRGSLAHSIQGPLLEGQSLSRRQPVEGSALPLTVGRERFRTWAERSFLPKKVPQRPVSTRKGIHEHRYPSGNAPQSHREIPLSIHSHGSSQDDRQEQVLARMRRHCEARTRLAGLRHGAATSENSLEVP